MDNKKNTILLTVIAVATLLVAALGATFAFFSAQGASRVDEEVKVTTSTSNTASFFIKNDIEITANEVTFAEGKGDRTGSTIAAAKYKASSNEDADVIDFCYNISLEIEENDFEYTVNEDTPELMFVARKSNAEFNTAKANTLENDPTLIADSQGDLLIEKDITAVVKGEKIQVPNSENGTDYKHVIKGVKGVEVIDNYYFKVSFINLDTTQNDNADKTFTGSIVFDAVECD